MTPIFATTLGFSDFAIVVLLAIVFAGARAFTTRKPVDLRRIERKLDALLKHQGIELPSEAERLARDPKQKLAAIAAYREENPGVGLAEAKAKIEEIYKKSL